MMQTHTLQQTLELSFAQELDGRYRLTAKNERGLWLRPNDLATFLFFRHERMMFGMLVDTNETAVILHIHELLDALSLPHPYVHWKGQTTEDEKLLNAFQEAAQRWKDPAIWEHASVQENELIIDPVKAHISEQAAAIMTQATQQKMKTAGIPLEQVQPLLRHLRTYGWPKETKASFPLEVAFRLTEPEESSSEWSLETVIVNPRGKHWTPPIRKRESPMEEALPEKWKSYASTIEERQNEMASLLQAIPLEASDRFLSCTMQDSEVRTFIQYDLPLFQSFGFPVILPAWLKSVTEAKMRVRTNAGVTSYQSTTGLDQVLAFDWSFSLADQTIDAQTFRQLVDENREYIRSGDEWFHMDPLWLKRIRELMEQADAGQWTVKDLLFQELPEELMPIEEEEEEDPLFAFSMQQSLRQTMEMLAEKNGVPAVPIPTELQAELRPYQMEGFNWLVFMRSQQFGACLADDMGLGKTIQLITYLLHVHRQGDSVPPSLIICPTSVLGNWQKEVERFAPSLSVHTYYGPSRIKEDEAFEDVISKHQPDVILTTYGTITQDGELVANCRFASITLDEAQNIKNMQTKQSRTIRKLQGMHHIALTGTPIENRLSELWAIFDFVHKGYFGSFRKFTEAFIVPIERDQSEVVKRRLRAKIRPFLLRRTKNDADLQLNLPKKLEQNEYCPLTTEQAALYESFLEETKLKLEAVSGFEKKGLILKMLSRLKQLCNHPALFLKEPHGPASQLLARSEKLDRIVSMAADIARIGEQCLIFTQYIGMGQLIRQCLSELHDIDVPFLTGSMPKGQRDRLVNAFQAKEFPVFILSLKAGGTGLNLTGANHVLHADRWWNPAVENQATDRAYRIGQTKFVHVHKFVTIGTIEEKIDKMLQEKAALSADLIQSSQWLTELSDSELADLLSFGD